MKLRLPVSPARAAGRAAFTLAEAVMAVGVAAVGVITLLGLLPVGLASIQQSATQITEARAFQAILAEYQMRDWASVLQQEQSASGELLYFDRQGFTVTSSDPEAFLLAEVRVRPPSPLPGAAAPNLRLRMVHVRISREVRLGAGAFAEGRAYRQTQALLSQMDKRP
ncbi:MAG: Verru_Chthon cassette protein B [Verrucomicrobiaceae bacterium]